MISILLQDSWYPGRIGSSRMLLVALMGETTPFLNDFFEAMASALRAPPGLPLNVISTYVSPDSRGRQPWLGFQSLGWIFVQSPSLLCVSSRTLEFLSPRGMVSGWGACLTGRRPWVQKKKKKSTQGPSAKTEA